MGKGSGQLGKSSGELAWGVGGRKKREKEVRQMDNDRTNREERESGE